MRKKVISALLITTMTITSIIPAYALSKGETVKQPTPVEVTTEAMQFDVTLPTKLPVTVKSDGEVVVATNTKIENNGFGPIVVKNLAVTPTTGWEIVDFNHDFSTEYMNSKKFGMTIYNIPVATDGTYPILEVNNGNYPKIKGNNYVNILYKVNTGTFIEDTTLDMATVTVTVGWDEAEIKDFEIKPPKVDVSELNPEDYGVDYIVEVGTQFYVTGVATYALDGEDPFYGVTWESSDPSVATVGAQDGLVTVLSAGYFDITGTLPSGESASVKYGVPKEGTSEIPEPIIAALIFEEESGNNFTFKIPSKKWDGTLEYSTDGKLWNTYNANTTVNSTNGKLYLRGSNNTRFATSTSYNNYSTIQLKPDTAKIRCSGDIGTLLDYTDVKLGNKPDIDNYAFYGLFSSCKSLVQTPELSNINLSNSCYGKMFFGCTSLTEVSELNTTELSSGCYAEMFSGCTSLTQAPKLPATSLASGCYRQMFYNCKSLVKAPELPALKATTSCYDTMFCNCIKLTDAPELPATTLESRCYMQMFSGCTSLKKAPELLSTTLAQDCYNRMFEGCTQLISAQTELPAQKLVSGCYTYMYHNCKSLKTAPKLPSTQLIYSCYQSMFDGCTSLIQAPELPATTLAENCYQNMFSGCTSLTQAPNLPATTLTNYCYQQMFINCTSLTQAPELPATTLADYCYSSMLSGCTSLTQAPELPATTLANYCYQSMFQGCELIVQAPELPATTLADHCYANMFQYCTSLTQAQALPATTLAEACYQWMFSQCTSLIKLPALKPAPLIKNCYKGMFNNCTSIKVSSTETGEYTIPYTISNTGSSVAAADVAGDMFKGTSGTYTGTAYFRTYYISNTNNIV